MAHMLRNSFNADYELDDVSYGSDLENNQIADRLR